MRRSSLASGAVGVVVLTVLLWVALDLFGPRSGNIRVFDAAEVARLETGMWRSYYDRERVRLFLQLGELLGAQYHLPPLSASLAAFHAARAAFVFKEGRSRSDYEEALPDLERFYAAIRRASNVPFDTERVARLELEWWVVHRERGEEAPGELVNALSELQAEVYRVPIERLEEHAQLRTEAMLIRDRQASQGGVIDDDWMRIEELLCRSWRSLSGLVNPSG